MFIYRFLLFVLGTALPIMLMAQPNFYKSKQLIPDHHFSNLTLLSLDVNKDFKDDLVSLSEGVDLKLYFQTLPNYTFESISSLRVDDQPQWAMLSADVDKDGDNEYFMAGVYDNIKYLFTNNNVILKKLEFGSNFYAQGSNLVDINKDGYLDLYFSNDDANNKIFIYDPVSTTFTEEMIIDFNTIPSSDGSGNYGSEWIDVDNDGDLDLFLAKCRTGVESPNDPRRINRLFINENGTFSDMASERGLADGAQSWLGSFGDMDNDGDLDCFVLNHHERSKLMINDGNGYFSTQLVDINTAGLQAIWQDLDNDTYLDLIIAGGEGDYILMNNQLGGFTIFENLIGPAGANSVVSGDFNSDGFIDIFYTYGEDLVFSGDKKDELWLNEGNENNWVSLNLLGEQSNLEGIGGRINLYVSGEKFIREVKGGSSYSITHSYQQHFGLGEAEIIDSMVVEWPLGKIDRYYSLDINSRYVVQEGKCISKIFAETDQAKWYCGEPLELRARNNYNKYQWSTGDTTESIMINEPGYYHYRVWDEMGCLFQSEGFYVSTDQEYLSLDSLNSNVICEGDSIFLSAVDNYSYQWSTGEVEPMISVKNHGEVSLIADSPCGDRYHDTIHINFLNNNFEKIDNDTVQVNQDGLLDGLDQIINWYEKEDDHLPISNDQLLNISNVQEDVEVFYDLIEVSGKEINDIANYSFTGQDDLYSSNTINSGLFFNAHQDILINSFKVYAREVGIRRIIIINERGEYIFSKSFELKIGENLIDLNAFIPRGNNYQITTDSDVNQMNIGSRGPDLARIKTDKNYPLKYGEVLEIETSLTGTGAFYYFFDWNVAYNLGYCTSPRCSAKVIVDTTSNTIELSGSRDKSKLFPNPSSGMFYLDSDVKFETYDVFDMRGMLVDKGRVIEGRLEVIKSLKSGIYSLLLSSIDGSRIVKIIEIIRD